MLESLSFPNIYHMDIHSPSLKVTVMWNILILNHHIELYGIVIYKILMGSF